MYSPEVRVFPSAYADLVLNYLDRHVQAGQAFRDLIVKAAMRQLDSALLIEDSFAPFRLPPQAASQIAIPDLPVVHAIEAVIDEVREEGLGPHLARLTGLFGSIMLSLSGSKDQINAVSNWVGTGASGAFFMTDLGGPSLQQWKTILQPEEDGALRLRVAKTWAIGAVDCGFAIVIATRSGAMAPTALLIEPEACAQLKRRPIGLPFLDGQLQLGDALGEIRIRPDAALARGGLIAVKQFLTVVRPRFVRSLMAHLDWLAAHGRLKMNDAQKLVALQIEDVARSMGAATTLTRHSEDEAMALKFASNALLFDLVESGAVVQHGDARDLLGMTKMEGSSYRCFHELYMRGKGLRE